jgi:hypothetical protein
MSIEQARQIALNPEYAKPLRDMAGDLISQTHRADKAEAALAKSQQSECPDPEAHGRGRNVAEDMAIRMRRGELIFPDR